jgi:rhodanese-related sulfurtransferase
MATRVDLDRMLELVGTDANLVDVLPATQFREVHIPGARNLPLATMRPELLDDLDRRRAIVVYCFDQH